MKIVITLALLTLPLAACKDAKDGPAVAAKTSAHGPIAKPPGADPRLRLAIAMPATLERGYVPGANLEREDEPMTLDAYQAELAAYDEAPAAARALADGWIAQVPDGDVVRSVVQRTLGGRVYRCESDGDDQAAHELGGAICLAIVAHGGGLAVPFAVPGEDGADLGIDDLTFRVQPATEDTPASPEAFLEDKGWRTTGTLVRGERGPDGFVALVSGRNGDLAANDPMWDALVRTRVAGADLACEPWSLSRSAEHAEQLVAACRSLRAY